MAIPERSRMLSELLWKLLPAAGVLWIVVLAGKRDSPAFSVFSESNKLKMEEKAKLSNRTSFLTNRVPVLQQHAQMPSVLLRRN